MKTLSPFELLLDVHGRVVVDGRGQDSYLHPFFLASHLLVGLEISKNLLFWALLPL
jgi:hypothetical protein